MIIKRKPTLIGGVTDHGVLSGLLDDDHLLYVRLIADILTNRPSLGSRSGELFVSTDTGEAFLWFV